MVIDEYVVGGPPEFLGRQINGICKRQASRVNVSGEHTHGVATVHESRSHLRDIIPDRVVWHEAGCEKTDVSGSGHGLTLSVRLPRNLAARRSIH
jgi:hypothetical protein